MNGVEILSYKTIYDYAETTGRETSWIPEIMYDAG